MKEFTLSYSSLDLLQALSTSRLSVKLVMKASACLETWSGLLLISQTEWPQELAEWDPFIKLLSGLHVSFTTDAMTRWKNLMCSHLGGKSAASWADCYFHHATKRVVLTKSALTLSHLMTFFLFWDPQVLCLYPDIKSFMSTLLVN